MASTLSHPSVIEEYIKDELSLSKLAGPFHRHAIRGVQINHFGVIPKNHRTDVWRLIVDMSHPEGALLAKIDIKSYRWHGMNMFMWICAFLSV